MIQDKNLYQAYLQSLTKFELLEELGSVKRSKYPEHYKLIELEQARRLQEESQRKVVQKWVDQLAGSYIRIRGYKDPVKVETATINSRGNAAIVRIEGESHNRYFAYKDEE